MLPDHFVKCCWSKKPNSQNTPHVKAIKTEMAVRYSSSDGEYTYSVHKKHKGSKKLKLNLKLNKVLCSILIDTGASVNILDIATYQKIGSPKLHKSKITPQLFPYGGEHLLKVIGQCRLLIETKEKVGHHTFYIVESSSGFLLGYPIASQLELVSIIHHIQYHQSVS